MRRLNELRPADITKIETLLSKGVSLSNISTIIESDPQIIELYVANQGLTTDQYLDRKTIEKIEIMLQNSMNVKQMTLILEIDAIVIETYLKNRQFLYADTGRSTSEDNLTRQYQAYMSLKTGYLKEKKLSGISPDKLREFHAAPNKIIWALRNNQLHLLPLHKEDIHKKDVHGRTPLEIAIIEGKNAAIEPLIELGANKNQIAIFDGQKPHEKTLFHLAVFHANVTACKILQKLNVQLRSSTPSANKKSAHRRGGAYSRNLLQFASISGNYQFCDEVLSDKELLKIFKPLLDLYGKNNPSPLMRACYNLEKDEAYIRMALLMLKHGANPDLVSLDRGRLPLHIAVSRNCMPLITALLDAPSRITKTDRSGKNYPEGTGGINRRDHHGENVLFYAESKELTQFLIDRGAKVLKTYRDETPLHRAAQTGNIKRMQVLLHAGAKIDSYINSTFDDPNRRETPLRMAAGGQQVEAVKFLLSIGANPTYARGATRHPEIVRLLGGHNDSISTPKPNISWVRRINRCTKG